MQLLWFKGLSSARRFGAAVRLQKQGRVEEARQALVELNEWLDSLGDRVSAQSLQLLTTRLMSLVHLAQLEIKAENLVPARDALRRWEREWNRATKELPRLQNSEELANWEAWVQATLQHVERKLRDS